MALASGMALLETMGSMSFTVRMKKTIMIAMRCLFVGVALFSSARMMNVVGAGVPISGDRQGRLYSGFHTRNL
jgi:hypothetical protein